VPGGEGSAIIITHSATQEAVILLYWELQIGAHFALLKMSAHFRMTSPPKPGMNCADLLTNRS